MSDSGEGDAQGSAPTVPNTNDENVTNVTNAYKALNDMASVLKQVFEDTVIKKYKEFMKAVCSITGTITPEDTILYAKFFIYIKQIINRLEWVSNAKEGNTSTEPEFPPTDEYEKKSLLDALNKLFVNNDGNKLEGFTEFEDLTFYDDTKGYVKHYNIFDPKSTENGVALPLSLNSSTDVQQAERSDNPLGKEQSA